MKPYLLLLTFIPIILTSCSSKQIGTSTKTFPPISLTNHFEYFSAQKCPLLGTAFLLKYDKDTFAITAKHTMAFLKPDSSKTLTTEHFIKKWTMSPLNKENEMLIVKQLLNEDKNEELKSRKKFETDWLVFSIDANTTNVKPLELRETTMQQGEKCYAVGWTRHMKDGDQRVFEF